MQWTLVVVACCLAPSSAEEPVDRESNLELARSAASLLLNRCVGCHSDKKAEGGYDLSRFDLMRIAGDSKRTPLTPAKLGESELYTRLIDSDPDRRMPAGGPPMDPVEIDIIRKWIEAGASPVGSTDAKLIDACAQDLYCSDVPEHYPSPIQIGAIAVSQDGAEVWVGGYGEVTRWNTADGKLLERLRPVGTHVAAISLTSDGLMLAVSSGQPGEAGIVQIFKRDEESKGIFHQVFLLRDRDVAADLAFAPHSHQLAIAFGDGSIQVLDADRASLLFRATPHADAVLAVAWSPEGTHLLTASRDRSARNLDVKESRWVTAFDRHERSVGGIAYVKQRPMTIDETGKLRLWNRDNGEYVEADYSGMDRRIQKIASFGETLLAPSEGRVRRLKIEYREVDDGKDDKGNPKKRNKAFFKETESLMADSEHLLTSISVLENGWVVCGSQHAEVFAWRLGVDQEATPKFRFRAVP